MKQPPTYYSILTADVRYSDKITWRQKVLYSELTCLTQTTGYAFASNSRLAKWYGVTNETISRDISALEKAGFIRVVIDKKDGNQRRIYLTNIRHPIDEMINTPIDEIVKHNNTSNNSIDISEIKQNVIRYFIDKVDGAYPVIPEPALYDNLKTIIDKGYTVEQIKKLIDHKAAQFHRREIDTKVFRLSWMFKPVNFFEQYSIMERPAQPKQRKSGTNNGKRINTNDKDWNEVKSL